MNHPSESELALFAGGDLGWMRQRLTERHVRRCDTCQASVSGFSELRPEAGAFPALSPRLGSWNRLQSEMTANIRLGLAAGECVSVRPARSFTLNPRLLPRVGVSCLVILSLAGAGYVVRHPPVRLFGNAAAASGTLLEASETGLQLHEGGRTLRILNTSGKDVSHSVGARGEVGARYVDPNGYVTISQVYGQ